MCSRDPRPGKNKTKWEYQMKNPTKQYVLQYTIYRGNVTVLSLFVFVFFFLIFFIYDIYI